MSLSRAELEHFHGEGYLVVEDLLRDDDLKPAIDDLCAAVGECARTLVGDGALSRDYAELDFEHRLDAITRETPLAVRAIQDGQLHSAGIFSLLTNTRLLDLAESLCGPELIASSVYRVRPKAPSNPRGPVPWHQDSAYLEPYCDPALIVTAWIPLVDADAERGCMWVIPGAHTNGIVRHRADGDVLYLHIAAEDLPRARAPVCCPVRKGGALLMTNRTPHASFENRSDVVRWAVDTRFQAAALPTNADVTRIAGESRPSGSPGGDDYVPAGCFPPEADFLVRSSARPTEVLRTAEAFAALRSRHRPGPFPDRWGFAEAVLRAHRRKPTSES